MCRFTDGSLLFRFLCAFLGGFTVAMMANDYQKVNGFSVTFEGLNDSYWFNLNTRVLYLFALTGNFWEPEI